MKNLILFVTVVSLLVPSLLIGKESSEKKEFDYMTELKNDFHTAYGKTAKNDVLKDKTILLYFTASWCPPCQAFTPKLVKFAQNNKSDVTVVVISMDSTKEDALKYMKKNEAEVFYLIPPGKESNRISKQFGIQGIPSVVAISKTGSVLSKNARGQITGGKLPKDWK